MRIKHPPKFDIPFLVHLGLDLLQYSIALTVEKHHGKLNILAVCLRVNHLHTRGTTAFDLMLESGSRAIFEIALLAVTDHKELLQDVQASSDRTRGRKRAKVFTPPALFPTMKGKSRVLGLSGDMDVRIGLIVSQQDVIGGAFGLNQALLKQQRLGLALNDGDLNAMNFRNHSHGLGR